MSGSCFKSGCSALLLVVVSGWLTGCPPDPSVNVNNPADVVLERTAASSYTPGSEFTVTVTINAADGPSITALGLTEAVPEGWAFVSANGGAAVTPDVAPQEGEEGELGFAWIDIPDFPFTFSYTLLVPEDAPGTAEIAGRADYYQNEGLLSSDELVSTLTSAEVSENPAGVVLARAADTTYTPGATLTITVTINAADGDSITSLGLTETLPEGWVFVSESGDGSASPAITPQAGAGGELGFAWVSIPAFPFTFNYTLMVPEDAAGPAELTGQVNYYQDMGLLLTGEVVSEFTGPGT